MMLHDVQSQDNRLQTHGSPGLNFRNNGTVTASNTQPNHGLISHAANATKLGTSLTNAKKPGTLTGPSCCAQKQTPSAMCPQLRQTTTQFWQQIGEDHEEGFSFLINGETKGMLNDATMEQVYMIGLPMVSTKPSPDVVCQTGGSCLIISQQFNVFCNKALLTNIYKAPSSCQISFNAGVVTSLATWLVIQAQSGSMVQALPTSCCLRCQALPCAI